MMSLQEAVARRVRALLEKTVENGATEAEAIAAATKARELLDQYRLTMTDLEIQAEPIEIEVVNRPNENRVAAVDYCMNGIREYCGVKLWYNSIFNHARQKYIRNIKMLGLKTDIEMARYLYQMIAATIERETMWFRQHSHNYRYADNRRNATSSFQVGMAWRINTRLCEMAQELAPVAKSASGTSLVVVKDARVKEAYDALNLKFGSRPKGMSTSDSSAYGAGRAAGDRVNLRRPVGGRSQHSIGR